MAPPRKDIVVIGASAGGIAALEQLVADLPANFPAAILISVHLAPWNASQLPEILSRHGSLPASHPQTESQIRNGHIYVAPPNQHLLIKKDRIKLSSGPQESRARPAINAMFRSAAAAYGPRVIGVLLTGMLDDGTSGLWEIKECGGTTIVQDPLDALHPDMPQHALDNVSIDYVVPIRKLAPLLIELAGQPLSPEGAPQQEEAKMQEFYRTDLTCPECRGPISEFSQKGVKEFRCRVGHRYAPETFLVSLAETRERALWAAVVVLEEGADVAKDLAGRVKPTVKSRYEQEANHNEKAAAAIRDC